MEAIHAVEEQNMKERRDNSNSCSKKIKPRLVQKCGSDRIREDPGFLRVLRVFFSPALFRHRCALHEHAHARQSPYQ